MRLLSHSWRRLRTLLPDLRGGLAPFFALSIIPMVGFIGLATDTARGYIVKSRLSYALDAAGLAGGRVMFSPTRDADIQMFFDANFPAEYMDAILDGPNFSVDANGEVITLTANATINTTFMRVLGFETLSVAASTEVTRETQLLEVVLAIDMSGSMNWGGVGGGTRIEAARAAGVELVNILFGADETKDLLKIGLVPWNGKVNASLNGVAFDSGATVPQAVPNFINPVTGAGQSEVYYTNNSPVAFLSAPDNDWQGCAYARFTDDSDNSNDADLMLGYVSTGGVDWMAWEPIGPEGEPVSGGTCTSSSSGSECIKCLEHGITAMTNQKTAILNAINELTNPDASTNIPQGLAWAWRVLMPEAPFTEGETNPQGRREQAIVLLTDGENCGWEGDGYKGVFGLCANARPEMDDRLRQIATAIKAQDVTIYAIQFANDGTALQQLMKDIASGPDAPFYFYAPDASALSQAFMEVANNLSELRLSK